MKNYVTANEYFKTQFGAKVYKIALDGGMNCPNRTPDKKGGCIFCSSGGSGDFAEKQCGNVTTQINNAIKRVESKKPQKFIAYFQSYTNTFAPLSYLRQIFFETVKDERVCAISIATRPDCLGEGVLALLLELSKIKPVFVELGLQTASNETARLINRGYDTSVYLDAVKNLKAIGINVITHVIIGLPNETEDDLLATIRTVNESGSDGIKLQLLHVLKDTRLACMYENGEYTPLEMDEYIRLLMLCLQNLREGMVVHRITGDAPKRILLAPLWSADKKRVLNSINKELAKLQ